MSILDTGLAEHAARLLIGTDLTPDMAAAVAGGSALPAGAVAVALREGWTSATAVPAQTGVGR